jgi:hypothetical protein
MRAGGWYMDNYKAECILSGPYADQMNNIINQRIWCDGEYYTTCTHIHSNTLLAIDRVPLRAYLQ